MFYNSQAKPKCADKTNYFFVQYSCEQTNSDQAVKYKDMVVAVCTGTLVCMLFSVAIKWKYQGGKVQ